MNDDDRRRRVFIEGKRKTSASDQSIIIRNKAKVENPRRVFFSYPLSFYI